MVLAMTSLTANAGQRSGTTDEGDGQTRESPYAFGESGKVGDYEIEVVEVTPDAHNAVILENQFNEPAPEGETFFMARVAVTYVGRETGTPWVDLEFNIVGKANRGYSENDASCGVIPDEASDAPELCEDGSAEFNVCWSVPSEEVGSLLMYVEPRLSFDDERVWFSLDDQQGEATPSSSPAS